jgi:hypothetical protein
MKTTLLFLLAMMSLLPAQDVSPKDWSEWAERIEKQYPITDAQGHGPDIGGDEWAGALDKRLKITDDAGHGPDIKSMEWRQAVEKKLKADAKPAAEEDRKLLSSHDTVARFTGVKDHKCMGLTALCPDRCGHSGKLATFEIIKYVDYKKPGEYGDPKQESFQVLIVDNMGNAKVPAAIRDAILALKPGDKVHLKWNHDYVTREGSKSPERPILKVSPLTADEAAENQLSDPIK